MKKKTFKELYDEEKSKPTAAQVFVSEVAKLTMRSEVTVRQWLSGVQTPDSLVRETIARHFNVSTETLFPNMTTTK